MFSRLLRSSIIRNYATASTPETAAKPGLLKVNFALPHQVILRSSEARQVNIKTSDGDMGILSNHVPAILQLVPGILEIHGDKITKYFVSGGFATVNADSSMNINAVEACLLEQVDQASLKTEIDSVNKAITSATGEKKALLMIELAVFEELLKSK